jgi:hypothetical protein
MAFTRKYLTDLNLTEAQIDAVMEEHVAVTDALKKQRDEYKAEADKLPDIQKQLDEIKGGEDYKARYESEHKAYEEYKAQVKAEADLVKVKAAYRKLLQEEHVSEKRLDAVIRLTDFSKMKLDGDGNLQGADDLRKAIKEEWGDYIPTQRTQRENVATPPAAGKSYRDKAEIMAIKDTAERQKAIAENHELFGF